MKLDALNEQNYWAPLRALAADAGCAFRQGNKDGDGTTAYFLINDEVIAYVVPVTSFSYYTSHLTGFRAHGKYMPKREQRRGGYFGDYTFQYSQRKTLDAVLKELRPALRSETPREAYSRQYNAARERLTVNAKRPRYSPEALDGEVATKMLVVMFREGLLTDERVLFSKVGSTYMGMDKPAIPILLHEVLEQESRRVDLEIGNECITEILHASYDAGLKLAGFKE